MSARSLMKTLHARMYPDIRVATGAAATPTGKATRVPGGYHVEGRFPFVSGCQHCQWRLVGCIVHEDGTPRTDANGVPETRQCFIEVSQCEILDTWYTTGLRVRKQRHPGAERIYTCGAYLQLSRPFARQTPRASARIPIPIRGQGASRGTRHRPPCCRCTDRERWDKICPAVHAR